MALLQQTEIFTWQDVVDHLTDMFDARESNRPYRLLRRAIDTCYRRLPNLHDWSYYYALGSIETEAEYTTGTVTYDHSGSTYERELTLASGTWPANAALGWVIIDSKFYRVATRESDTVVTLDPLINPGADVAAGTDYTWFRDTYPLPVDFISCGPLIRMDTTYELRRSTPTRAIRTRAAYSGPARPTSYVIWDNNEYFGGMSVQFTPPPDTAELWHYIYKRRPFLRRPVTWQYATGTVSITGGTAAVTSSGATFTEAKHKNAIIRFVDSATAPTGFAGALVSGTHVDNPYAEQRSIIDVPSSSTLTVDANVQDTYTTKAFTIEDPIDIEAGAMWECFLRMCEAELDRLMRSKTRTESDQRFREALREAMGSDNREFNIQDGADGPMYTYESIQYWLNL